MSEKTSQRLEQSDAELITAVRTGENAAYGALFERHRSAALRLARQLLPGAESEDLVSEAFTKVFVLLQDGKGPDLAFRAYLLTAVRRLHVDRIRAVQRLRTTDDEAELDRHVEFFDLAAANFERGTASDAFASLPERWQLVLWHLDVEGQKPADVAPMLGMSANSVSALAYRAREGLRQAYLQHHLADTATGNCRWTTERLGAHVRKGLSNRDAARVDEHLDECRRCMGIYLELTEVNSNLSGILAPQILGTAAAGYLAAGTTAGVVTTVGATVGVKALMSVGVKAAIAPVKAVIAGATVQGTAAAVVVAGVATTGVVATTTELGPDLGSDRTVATAPAVPGPTTLAPVEPPPEPTAEPTVEPTLEPVEEPLIDPVETEPVPTITPLPNEPLPSVDPPPIEPEPEPPPPIVPTDLGIGTISIANESSFLQRRITVPVSSQTDGLAKDLDLTLTITFDRAVRFGGVVSPEWGCGEAHPNTSVTSVTCARPQSGPEVPSFVFTAKGIRPSGTVTISALDNADPIATNDSAGFQSGPWLLLF